MEEQSAPGQLRRALARGALLLRRRGNEGPSRRPGARRATSSTSAEGRWLINPGSVGQPRDGDPRAAWLELDTEAWRATYHRVEYEIDRAAERDPGGGAAEHCSPSGSSGPMSMARPTQGCARPLASIAAMPGSKRILTSVCLAASAALAAGCGGDEEPEPSIPTDNADARWL